VPPTGALKETQDAPHQARKSFLVLFFKKELFCSLENVTLLARRF
jgi:hypothetical protein